MSSPYGDQLNAIGNQAIEQLTERNRNRELGLAISREVIRLSANAIRAVHRGDFEDARKLIQRGGVRLQDAEAIRQRHPSIYHTGFMQDARKEFVEANITLAVIAGEAMPVPEPSALGVDPAAYLNGMAEVIGELRRFILDSLRRDQTDRCDELLEVMDEIYSLLVTVDFPEAVTAGLRHTTDAMRAVLERTRGDLAVAVRQQALEARLAQLHEQPELPQPGLAAAAGSAAYGSAAYGGGMAPGELGVGRRVRISPSCRIHEWRDLDGTIRGTRRVPKSPGSEIKVLEYRVQLDIADPEDQKWIRERGLIPLRPEDEDQ